MFFANWQLEGFVTQNVCVLHIKNKDAHIQKVLVVVVRTQKLGYGAHQHGTFSISCFE